MPSERLVAPEPVAGMQDDHKPGTPARIRATVHDNIDTATFEIDMEGQPVLDRRAKMVPRQGCSNEPANTRQRRRRQSLQTDGRLKGRSCIFDPVGTLFDFASAPARWQAVPTDQATALTSLWRDQQLQYAGLRSLHDRYADFGSLAPRTFASQCGWVQSNCPRHTEYQQHIVSNCVSVAVAWQTTWQRPGTGAVTRHQAPRLGPWKNPPTLTRRRGDDRPGQGRCIAWKGTQQLIVRVCLRPVMALLSALALPRGGKAVLRSPRNRERRSGGAEVEPGAEGRSHR